MKAKINKEGNWIIDKGKIHIEIIQGSNKLDIPVKVKYESTLYKSNYKLMDTIKAFEKAYSEEQVLEILIKVCGKPC